MGVLFTRFGSEQWTGKDSHISNMCTPWYIVIIADISNLFLDTSF